MKKEMTLEKTITAILSGGEDLSSDEILATLEKLEAAIESYDRAATSAREGALGFRYRCR